jgi:hypothetical protein
MPHRKPARRAGGIALAVIASLLSLSLGANDKNNDLHLDKASNLNSSIPEERLSPDIKVGAAFGDSSVPNLVRRGVENHVYGRFLVNGVDDYELESGDVQMRFHYRDATFGVAPPELGGPGDDWVYLGDIPVTFDEAIDGDSLVLTQHWPDDFPSVTAPFVTWTPATSGHHYHVRAEARYPTGITDDHQDDNVAISLYESILGLRNVDVVILHDASGSMQTAKHAGDTFLAQAKARAIEFVLTMSASDRLAVVAFGGCLPGGVADIWPGPPATLTPVSDWSTKVAAATAIGSDISVPDGGCLTPLGTGLKRASDILSAVSLEFDRKRAILLLGDGEENTGTLRACDGGDPTEPCLGAGLLAQLQANDIRVFSAALGATTPTNWRNCLECLSEETNGRWYATPGPGLALAEVYKDMQQAYTEDDLYRMDRGTTGGGDDTYATFFDGLDNVLYFGLETDDLNAELDLQLAPPMGAWTDADALPGAKVARGRGYLVARIAAPAAGDWRYRVVGEPHRDYLVSVRSDHASVRLALDDLPTLRVGEPIRIRARVDRSGVPVTDARPVAMVQAPFVGSLDARLRDLSRNYLLTHKARPPVGAVLEKQADISPRAALAQILGVDQQAEPVPVIRVPLKHEGDGVYSGTLARHTQVAGIYRVTVKASGDQFDRVQSQQIRVLPGDIDDRKSFAELLRLEPDGKAPFWLLRVYPQDRFGNAITNPSLSGLLKTDLRGGRPDDEPAVGIDGSIEQAIVPIVGRQPTLRSVRIGDRALPLAQESTPEPADQTPGRWIVMLLIVLLIAAGYRWMRPGS